ncbi:MAG: hypothetical protein J0H82_18375 [Alphaproteobacteria bacterium]|jgi:hypothetical protein|nr:hypothetical protein [Alphaproteobacteria bacterium]
MSSSMPSVAAREFLPQRFAERGAAVPFTSPSIAQGRVREDYRQQLELAVPALGGMKGSYIIRWAELLNVFPGMTLHDRVLRDEIERRQAATPDKVRTAALYVARQGLAGPEGAEAAARIIQEADGDRLLTTFFLILTCLEAAKTDLSLDLPDLVTPAGQQRVKAAIDAIATMVGLDGASTYDAIERWGEILAPAGLARAPVAARFRRLNRRIVDFAGAITDWSKSEHEDSAYMARFAGDLARLTASVADTALADLDRLQAKPLGVLRNWTAARLTLSDTVDRISWTLDGWEFILVMWDEAVSGQERSAQRSVVADIFRLLPLLPEGEISGVAKRAAADISTKRRVRVLHGWQTDALDDDIIERLERYKRSAV